MTLLLSHGPLSGDPSRTVNYSMEGPEHRLLFEAFPRRVRAIFAGQTVAYGLATALAFRAIR